MRRILLSFLLLAAVAFPAQHSSETALDRYVKAPDPAYKYKVVSTRAGADATEYVVDMTSQTWRTAAEVDRTEWKHWLTIIVPRQIKSSTGFLFITGGANDGKQPKSPRDLIPMAVDTGTVVSELRMVPNQPLTFAGETEGRGEDAFIVYTWDKFLRGGDERWPARLPMTKSAVRAMDTVTSVCAALPTAVKVDRFVVSGGSKRGWTTWTTAAVDPRVIAIVPLVIDVLNVEKSMDHHYRAYGFWAPAVGDYERMRIFDWSGSPEFRKLMRIEDPYEYRDRLTMPKYIVNASGDQFFLPDSSQFYFGDLSGEKHLRYVPNADHSLKGSDALASVHAFYSSIVSGTPRPELTWNFERDGGIRVHTNSAPSEVRLWQATNPAARDFRLESIGPVWKSSPLEAVRQGEYVGKATATGGGWTAYFIELTYPSGGRYPFKFTSPVRVTPDRLPHPAPARRNPK